VTVVILLQRDDLRDRAIRLFGSGDLHRTMTLMDEAARRLSRCFVSQLGVNAGVGFEIGTGLFFIGVPSPLLWGILAALLQHVPYVGIWIAAALATGLAVAVSPEWPAGDTARWSESLQSAISADHYATSIRSMVGACASAAQSASEELQPADVAA